MSDFIFSKINLKPNKITENIQAIYEQDKPSVIEFHGEWGSLGVSPNLYNGFKPYENEQHIIVVIGGPLLTYQNNNFLNNADSLEGTKSIHQRWQEGEMKWDEDLSGPFVVLIINKKLKEVTYITDLMSFIPVYKYKDQNNMFISTHVDALAKVSGQVENIDIVSMVDFILNGVVTYPYTSYRNIFQIAPATEHKTMMKNSEVIKKNYWIPYESNRYKSIKKAANDLKESLNGYVNRITDETNNVAQFISGGEDSRVISALLESEKKDSFIFLDSMNREGRIAKEAASIYKANFHLSTRHKLHYLNILPGCSDLIGSGSQYHHAHTYGFHKSCKLDSYSAVFGGLLADALLKGSHIKKIRGSGKLPLFPEVKLKNYSANHILENSIFETYVLLEVTKRRQDHLEYIKEFRIESSEEWFELWPMSMNKAIPNLHANRRLFSSYEPFMSNQIVKISAAVPQKWKLNRRLFHKMAKPLLKPSRWLRHSDGWYPYFSWVLKSCIIPFRLFRNKVFRKTKNQGPWGDWNTVLASEKWAEKVNQYSTSMKELETALTEKNISKLLNSNHNLSIHQRINFLQTLYIEEKHYKKNE